MSILLGVPNSSYIILDDLTGYGYDFSETLDKQDIRTRGGSLFSYITPAGSFHRFKITGRVSPFTKFVQPYFRQFYDGQLVIETI